MTQANLEQSVQSLVAQLERTEQRYERSQRQFRLMSLIFGGFMCVVVMFAIFRVEFVEKAEASILGSLQMDIKNLNTILSSFKAEFLVIKQTTEFWLAYR